MVILLFKQWKKNIWKLNQCLCLWESVPDVSKDALHFLGWPSPPEFVWPLRYLIRLALEVLHSLKGLIELGFSGVQGFKKKQNKPRDWLKQVSQCVPVAPSSSFCGHGHWFIVAEGKPNPLKCAGELPWAVILLGSLEILGPFSVPRHHGPALGLAGSPVLQTFICAFWFYSRIGICFLVLQLETKVAKFLFTYWLWHLSDFLFSPKFYH